MSTQNAPDHSSSNKMRWILIAVAVLLVCLIAVGLMLFWQRGGDQPVAQDTSQQQNTTTSTQARPVTTTEVQGNTQMAESYAAPSQSNVRSKSGDWEIRCDTPPGAPSEQCALMQYVTAADRDNVGLTVIVLKTADQSARILRVLTPLGVLLPHGLGLKIDTTDVGRAGFVRCLPQGCIAEVIMDEKLINLLETGQLATFIVFQTPEEGIGIPIALDGFKAGFEALN
ncbi:invasion associated locus B family protein [uncultured Cohaesibacter sp.]|uniref:invasion associated locus B family protein n=1 Tax=uncultured Cohaesibacter sp. TaxID=1002546 RepID=UPI00292DFC3F|nr:invasion associated locus B family protein [uncultured Cohaesibacter sp.]